MQNAPHAERFSLPGESAEWLALIGFCRQKAKLPYIHDREQSGTMACPHVMASNTLRDIFDGFHYRTACLPGGRNVPIWLHFHWRATNLFDGRRARRHFRFGSSQ